MYKLAINIAQKWVPPGPAGELTALPQALRCIKGKGVEGRGKGRGGGRKRKGGRYAFFSDFMAMPMSLEILYIQEWPLLNGSNEGQTVVPFSSH